MSPSELPQLVEADIAALAIGGFVAFALIVWDFICYIPDEIRLIKEFRKVEWRCPDPFCFFIVRYLSIAFAVSSLFTLGLKTDRCQFVSSMAQVFSVCVLGASGVLSARRTSSLWGHHKGVTIVMLGLYVCMVGSWIAVASQYRVFRVKETLDFGFQMTLPEFGTNCKVAKLVTWHIASYIASATYFGVVFLLAAVRCTRQRTERVLNLGLTPLNRACLWYFMTNLAASTAVLIVYASPWSTDVSRRTSSPFFILLVSGMGQRIFLNSQADYILRKTHIQEMASLNLKPKIPRWSWSPNVKKMSMNTFSPGSGIASPRIVPATPTTPHPPLPTSYQTYPRPPQPPPAFPNSPPSSFNQLSPMQKTVSIPKTFNRAGSARSSFELKAPPSSQGSRQSHGESDSGHSTEKLVPAFTRALKLSGSGRSREPFYGASDAESSINPVSSPSMSSSRGIGSPVSVSTMGFSSPPDSPAVLSIPWPGGRPPPDSKRVPCGRKAGAKPTNQANGRVRRYPSIQSGWT